MKVVLCFGPACRKTLNIQETYFTVSEEDKICSSPPSGVKEVAETLRGTEEFRLFKGSCPVELLGVVAS